MIAVKKVKHVEQHYEMWTDADTAKFRAFWAEETPQRQALEILILTGLRRSDAVKLGPKHVIDRMIRITTRKTKAELEFPVHPDLVPFLKTRDHGRVANIASFISTAYGGVRSEKGFTKWIKGAADKGHLPAHRSPHGLRRASCRALAEAGCSVWEIISTTGHQNSEEVQAYVADIGKKKLAQGAMQKLKGVS